jgi:stearoyl-CoA desaturase (delta-9 desaturase)
MQSLTAKFPSITGVRWFNLAILLVTPALAVYGFTRVDLLFKTLVFAMAYYWFTVLGESISSMSR